MRVRAFMPLFQEADIAQWSIRHLISQGVEVYVIDGWSTDGGWEMLPGLGVVGRERLPLEGDDGIWNCTRLLKRVQTLAWESGADWCILNDADEFRYGHPEFTIPNAIAGIDPHYNVIDSRVLSFQPIDNGWTPDKDPLRYFRYYTENPAIDMVCGIPQEKIWRNDYPVDLVTHGGHVIHRPDKCVPRWKWLMKHLGCRTQEQTQLKLATRLSRRCPEEHERGWGVHYDAWTPETNFILSPETLKLWA